MQIQINPGDVTVSDAMEEHIRTALDSAMRHVADRVTRIEVHLRDDASKKAGERDKRCTIEVRIAGMQPLAVEHQSDDLYDAIRQAAGKAQRAVEHKLDRRDTHHKGQ